MPQDDNEDEEREEKQVDRALEEMIISASANQKEEETGHKT